MDNRIKGSIPNTNFNPLDLPGYSDNIRLAQDKEELFDPDNFLSDAEKDIIVQEMASNGMSVHPTPSRLPTRHTETQEDSEEKESGMSALQRKILGLK